ncbi:ORF2 [Simian adenovirus 17]|uniref:ORF2 n=1 Tax=Simian adenovirus 17 TaxID=1715779 RepID=A0A2H4CJY3_9ADEN|nr:ORF2 [Simian adenovirus 17]
MYLLRPVFVSVVVPEELMEYLHNLDFSVVEFMHRHLGDFWLHMLHCVTPPFQHCSCGFLLLRLTPSLEIMCVVTASDLIPGGELTALVCEDLNDFLQLMLRVELRESGIDPNISLLNRLQVVQETGIFQS